MRQKRIYLHHAGGIAIRRVCLLVGSSVCSFVSSHPVTGYNGRRLAGRSEVGFAGEQRCTRLTEVAPYERFFYFY